MADERCPSVCKQLDMHWGAIPNQCDGPFGHPGKHWSYMGACEPVANLVWEDDPDHSDGGESGE